MAWLLDNSFWGPFFRQLPLLRGRLLNAGPRERAGPVPWVLGAAIAVRRTAIMAVRGFDESYFMYFEEIDLCDRLWAAGWQVHIAPAALVVHAGSASTRQRRSSMQEQYIASALQFYGRRYGCTRFSILKRILQLELAFRAIHGWLRLKFFGPQTSGESMAEDLITWTRLIRVIQNARYAKTPSGNTTFLGRH